MFFRDRNDYKKVWFGDLMERRSEDFLPIEGFLEEKLERGSIVELQKTEGFPVMPDDSFGSGVLRRDLD